MNVYGDLLQEMVTAETKEDDRPVSDLVSRVITRRAAMSTDPTTGRSRGSAASTRLGDALYYDAALVHLCERLGIDHNLVGEQAGPTARGEAERRLVEAMPALSDALGDDSEASKSPTSRREQ